MAEHRLFSRLKRTRKTRLARKLIVYGLWCVVVLAIAIACRIAYSTDIGTHDAASNSFGVGIDDGVEWKGPEAVVPTPPTPITVTTTRVVETTVTVPDEKDALSTAPRANACIVILCRNSDLSEILKSLEMFEDSFNGRYKYPYVFLNDDVFTDEFRTRVTAALGNVEFGHIPVEHWSFPAWINVTLADEKRNEMGRRGIIYGGSVSYRHMCRFNSGFFFRQKLLEKYDYYWRIEPSTKFFCKLSYDPFVFMRENNIEYGFTITIHEYLATVPTFWSAFREFRDAHPELIPERNSMKFMENEDGTFNLCHYWSNFEIGSLKFFRSERYLKYFDFLDKKGGFFYERWGDAPVHSAAISLFLPPEKIHFFDDIGYYHPPYSHCPSSASMRSVCSCDPAKSFDWEGYSCHRKWMKMRYSI